MDASMATWPQHTCCANSQGVVANAYRLHLISINVNTETDSFTGTFSSMAPLKVCSSFVVSEVILAQSSVRLNLYTWHTVPRGDRKRVQHQAVPVQWWMAGALSHIRISVCRPVGIVHSAVGCQPFPFLGCCVHMVAASEEIVSTLRKQRTKSH